MEELPPQEPPLLSPASVSGGRCRVSLFRCPPHLLEPVLEGLASRSPPPPEQQAGGLFLQLAWLQEWCRMNRIPILELSVADSPQTGPIEFQLQALIATPKKCFVCGSTQFFVACARCSVACWCSENCLQAGYSIHHDCCSKGSQIRDFFGL